MSACRAAVILAAGRGTRLQRQGNAALDAAQQAVAATGYKAMMPDARGRPFIDHVVSSLADAGIDEVCIVIRRDDDPLAEHYRAHPPRRVRLAFVAQPAPRGTAEAILRVASWAQSRPFLALNADNIYPQSALRALAELATPGVAAFDRAALLRESNIDAARIAAFATLTVDREWRLLRIVEKPPPEDAAAAQWIGMNLWRFDAGIFDACRNVAPSPRGELELPLAVAGALAAGMFFRVVPVHEGVIDLSSRSDAAVVSRLLADREVTP